MSKKKSSSRKEVVIHWYRHGLRLHDNPALLDSLTDCKEFYPVFIFDGEVAGMDDMIVSMVTNNLVVQLSICPYSPQTVFLEPRNNGIIYFKNVM